MRVIESDQMQSERKLKAIEAIQAILRNSSDISTDEFREFLQYKSSLQSRQRLYKNFTDENGNFTMYEKGSRSDKETLNTLSRDIIDYEVKMTKTPIFDMLANEMKKRGVEDSELPEFLRDVAGRWAEAGRWDEVEILKGWYQNSRGDLFHYDGTVWDEVPNERIKDLEYLGE